jgi:hypothetical protein
MMVSPAMEMSPTDQRQYTLELKTIRYVYHLAIYDANHVLVDSIIQFTRGCDLEAFLTSDQHGNLEVIVLMSLENDNTAYDTFNFNGYQLARNSDY